VRRALIAAMITIVAMFLALHLVGARACVGVLSGTLPASDEALALGLAYGLAWFAAVVLVPIATLAMIFDTLVERRAWRASRRP